MTGERGPRGEKPSKSGAEERVDHVEDARELLRATEEDGARGESMAAGLSLAQAHAQLAIAEELQGIRESGCIPGCIRLALDSQPEQGDLCGEQNDFGDPCTQPAGHSGVHRSVGACWPQKPGEGEGKWTIWVCPKCGQQCEVRTRYCREGGGCGDRIEPIAVEVVPATSHQSPLLRVAEELKKEAAQHKHAATAHSRLFGRDKLTAVEEAVSAVCEHAAQRLREEAEGLGREGPGDYLVSVIHAVNHSDSVLDAALKRFERVAESESTRRALAHALDEAILVARTTDPDWTTGPSEWTWVRERLDERGQEAVPIGTQELIEKLTEECPVCEADDSGGGVDEPPSAMSTCTNCVGGRVPATLPPDPQEGER